jgi:hypothetical protein
METSLITAIVFGLFFILMSSGQPVFAALATTSIAGILMLQGPSGLGAVSGVLYDRLNSFTLVAVPLFILMGEAVFVTGIGSELYTAANSWLNKVRGGMAMASVIASAVFGALCGVSIAGAAAIGSFAIPEMLKRGYHKTLAVGPVTAAGALSLLIPPSIAFIVYGEVADESVGKLFLGGVVPGLGIFIGEAMCSPSFISPAFYRQFVLSQQQKLIGALLKYGAESTILHICANTVPIMRPYAVETGTTIVDLDWQVDVAETLNSVEMRQTKTLVRGNLDPANELLRGNPQDVLDASRKLIESVGKNTRFILGSGCAVNPDSLPANCKAMVEAAERYGRF